VKGLILAAGRGSRMRELTRHRPKCMLSLGDQTLIRWQISALSAAGVTDLAVVRGYLGHRIDAPEVRFIDNPRWADTNMVASLLCARDWIGKETAVVSYSDIVYGAGSVRELISMEGEICIVFDPNWLTLWSQRFTKPLDDAETFQASDDGTLLEIGQRATSLGQIKGQFMGLLLFRDYGLHQVISYVDKLSDDVLDQLDMTDLMSRMLVDGVHISAQPISGNWAEVDSEFDLRLYEGMLADRSLDLS